MNRYTQKVPVMAWILLLTLAFIWGSSFILIKKGLIGLLPEELGSLRIVSAALLLLPSAIISLTSIARKNLFFLLISGFLGSLLPSFLYALAQTHLESAITGVVNGLVPFFTILIAYFLFAQMQNAKVYVGILIGLAGTTLLAISRTEHSSIGINGYALLVVLATICYAINFNLIQQKLHDIPPLSLASIPLLLVSPFAIVHLFGFTDYWDRLWHVEGVAMASVYICILGVMSTALGAIIFTKVLQMTDAIFTSSVTYIVPIFAVAWGLLDGEHIDSLQYVGIVAIGIGVYMVNKNRKYTSKSNEKN